MRGNLEHGRSVGQHSGSIPAYAGEPLGRAYTHPRCAVYPRVCGGTVYVRLRIAKADGLSPRMRGNQGYDFYEVRSNRSIPAYAGEPNTKNFSAKPGWVYPRVCGGTGHCQRCGALVSGLSPRMRGNRVLRQTVVTYSGSIPAYAGEPRALVELIGYEPVYPRVCGGTPFISRTASAGRGLSPRMRGNPPAYPKSNGITGSIPAYAGEPHYHTAGVDLGQVYPRVCGGTSYTATSILISSGLSPRMRGNRQGGLIPTRRIGSIPAYAGEPQTAA